MPQNLDAAAETVWTIGHSNRPIEEFVRMLEAHSIEVVADVRTVPKSRHNPQFDEDLLPGSLREHGIYYLHFKELGGLRTARRDSINTGWKNSSFRGYADHMQTEEFARSLDRLMAVSKSRRIAVMCAESVPWRCHRSLVGDALLVRGVPVMHILSAARSQAHKLTSFARVHGTRITYPGEPLLLV